MLIFYSIVWNLRLILGIKIKFGKRTLLPLLNNWLCCKIAAVSLDRIAVSFKLWRGSKLCPRRTLPSAASLPPHPFAAASFRRVLPALFFAAPIFSSLFICYLLLSPSSFSYFSMIFFSNCVYVLNVTTGERKKQTAKKKKTAAATGDSQVRECMWRRRFILEFRSFTFYTYCKFHVHT